MLKALAGLRPERVDLRPHPVERSTQPAWAIGLQSAEARFLDGLDSAVRPGDRRPALDCRLLTAGGSSSWSGCELFQATTLACSPHAEAVAVGKRFLSHDKEDG